MKSTNHSKERKSALFVEVSRYIRKYHGPNKDKFYRETSNLKLTFRIFNLILTDGISEFAFFWKWARIE